MNKKYVISAIERGIIPGTNEDLSEKIIDLISENKENSKIIFAPGNYFIKKRIEVESLKNVDIIGYGAKIISAINVTVNYGCSGGFKFDNCDDCSISGFSFNTERATNVSARVTAINLENNTFDVKVDDIFIFNGNEKIFGIDSMNENYSCNFHMGLSDNNSYKYEMIGDKHLRISLWHTVAYTLKNISVGELICLRHGLYSMPPFIFNACNRILLEDITIESTAGHCCGVYPRSSDFTFRRFNVREAVNSCQPYTSCSDGIHIKGLTGKLILENCHFYNMGDDALNIHNSAGTVFSVEDDILKIGMRVPEQSLNEPPKTLLPEDWARKGDIIYIYDENTLKRVGSFTIEEFKTENGYNIAKISNFDGVLHEGLKLANSAYNAEVFIDNCSVTGSRARGFLLQTENVSIQNCRFSRITSAGLMLCCDVSRWNELGPVRKAIIKNNVFDGCGVNMNRLRAGGIVIGVNHINICAEKLEHQGVHENIEISNNKFLELKDSAIFADAVSGLKITDNVFQNCCSDTENRPEEYCSDILMFNCDNLNLENNVDLIKSEISVFKD
ncbi:MAG: hypothetical protein IJT84_07845 [Clostridia bacterium]|nr:hypothetical protein [Clostridia bacterium]